MESENHNEVLQLLPPRLRQKARVMLHYLKSKLQVNGEGRVVYSDGTQGSHLYDLLRYYASPAAMSTQRLEDAKQFGILLYEVNAPPSAFTKRLGLKRYGALKRNYHQDS